MKRLAAALIFAAVTASLYAQSSEQQLFLDAEGWFQNGDYALALQQYDAFLKAYPLSSHLPDVQFRRAVCLYRLGRTQEALDSFRQVEVRYPQTRFLPYVPFWIGLSQYRLKEWTGAVISFDAYLSGHDDTYRNEALLYKAVSDVQIERYSDARLTLVNLMNRVGDPANQPYALAELSWLDMKSRDYHGVLTLLSKVDFAKIPDSFRSRLTLYKAEAYYETGDAKDAEPLYVSLLSGEPEVASVAYQRLFSIYQADGDAAKLTDVVNRAEVALAGMPKILAEFWLRVGIDDYKAGKLDLAESYLARVWGMRSSLAAVDPLVPLYLSEIYSKTSRLDQAIALLKQALPGATGYQDLMLFRLAGFQTDAGQLEGAKENCDAFLKSYPNSQYYGAAAYLDTYLAYRLGDFTAAASQVGSVLSSAKGGDFASKLLKLQALADIELGRLADAVSVLKQYLPLDPGDVAARVDLIKVYFQQKDYSAVLSEAAKLEAAHPDLKAKDAPAYLLVRYLAGLALISEKKYSDALASLRSITLTDLKASELAPIAPYLTFYEGWATYRLADYSSASSLFAQVISSKAPADLVDRSLYLSGWCAYLQGDYAKASDLFLKFADASTGEERERGLYMEAKSQTAAKRYDLAATTYEGLFKGSPASPFAAAALYGYAGVLVEQGKMDAAAAAYGRVASDYPTDPLADAALYRKGEVLYQNKQFGEAQRAFAEYRLKFPNGGKVDAALYWGGRAAYDEREDFGAVLLWNQLIRDYKKSAFRPDAMQRVAAIYAKRGDLQSALNLYDELLAAYPKEASAVGAADEAQKIKYLMQGQSSQEAELLVKIGKDGGAESSAGRSAMIDLARVYLYSGGGKMDAALPLLDAVVGKWNVDPADAAQAQYYIGEYYYRKGDLARAANEFLVASTLDTANRDLTAASMYRAAVAANASGNSSDARRLVGRIEEMFPGTEWATEAKGILGGGSQ